MGFDVWAVIIAPPAALPLRHPRYKYTVSDVRMQALPTAVNTLSGFTLAATCRWAKGGGNRILHIGEMYVINSALGLS
jgi:hypothetical protein